MVKMYPSLRELKKKNKRKGFPRAPGWRQRDAEAAKQRAKQQRATPSNFEPVELFGGRTS